MNRHEYKGYWVEIFIEGDELEDCEDPFYYVPYIEIPEKGGVLTTGDRYVTILEARQGAEKFIDMLDGFESSEIHWIEDLPEGKISYETEIERQSWDYQQEERDLTSL